MRNVLGAGALVAVLITGAGCTSSSPGPSSSTTTRTTTTTGTRTVSPSIGSTEPVDAGPTRSTSAPTCPLVSTTSTANRVGMRLARITVQRTGAAVVGCRIYALQGGPLHNSEHLPGPNQPAVEIVVRRYASAIAAHNAFVVEARKGKNPQQDEIAAGNTGVCYQIAFDPQDRGQDWACAFSVGTRAVVIRTVVVKPAFNVVQVAREVAGKL